MVETKSYGDAYWAMYERVYGLVYNNNLNLAPKTTYWMDNPTSIPSTVQGSSKYSFAFDKDISIGTTYANIYAN